MTVRDRCAFLLVVLGGCLGCQGDPVAGHPAADAAVADVGASDAAAVDGADADRSAVADVGDRAGDGSSAAVDGGAPAAGSLLVLSYNVAGLPWGLSSADPYTNTPLMSPLLNAYDVALLQEDFSFTAQLSSAATHPYKSVPDTPQGLTLNDGLTVFARAPFADLTRQAWQACHGFVSAGSDCLAAKGFLVTEVTLAPGVVFDLYDLHMDAGQSDEDFNARSAQVDQLVASLNSRSAGKAVLLGGDTNLRLTSDVDNAQLLERLITAGGLTDACRALSCGDERIDRILVRSGATLELQPRSWALDGAFVDGQGAPLSDHEAVAVRIGWTVR